MANRYIKDTIWTSENLNKLSVYAERHFERILLATDDWGCLEISPLVLKGKCYPLKSDVTSEQIDEWNKELIKYEIIQGWVVSNRQYAKFVKFENHNEALEKHDPKTPCPPWLMRPDGTDPRSSDKTSEAFKRIEEAYITLSNNGHNPSMSEIAVLAKSSKSTVVKFFKRNKPVVSGTGDTNCGTDA